MNVQNTKIPKPRFEIEYVNRYHMQAYGADNLYPQHLQRITEASGTAELCLGRYAKFIEGDGFFDDNMKGYKVNRDAVTADDLLKDIAKDVARFGGYAIHVNYNLLGEITEMHHVPFECCRLGECDDSGYVSHILTHKDWTGQATVNGKRLAINEDTITRHHIYNPDPDVVLAQIAEAGGIEHYKGQILWRSVDGKDTYPTPIYDAAITDISTDEGLGNVKYRNVRNNFLVSCMLITKKGVPRIDEDGREIEQHMIDTDDLREFQGDENTGKIMLVELENEEDEPKVVSFPTRNYDKEYEVTDANTVERIYAQFHQELFYAIRIGKLGFSGSVMRDAYEYYAGEVTNEQRFISRGISELLSHWHDVTMRDRSTQIQPLRYIMTEGSV